MRFTRGRGAVRGSLLAVGVMGLGLAMTSCAQEAADETASISEDAVPTGAVPTIYVDRLVEHGDREQVRAGYQQAVAICREAGLPVSPLSEEDVEKIGTERWQLWHGPEQRAYRSESWTWGYASESRQSAADNCRFALSVEGLHEYQDASVSFHIDLANNEKTADAVDASVLETFPATAPTEADAAKVRDAFNATGPVDRMVAGQPCQEWSYPPGATVCVWSGGAQWGFAYGADGPFASIDGLVPDAIVLQAEPASGTKGDRLSTTEFTINAPLDLDDMKGVGAETQSGSRRAQ